MYMKTNNKVYLLYEKEQNTNNISCTAWATMAGALTSALDILFEFDWHISEETARKVQWLCMGSTVSNGYVTCWIDEQQELFDVDDELKKIINSM